MNKAKPMIECITKKDLIDALKKNGVNPGLTLEVHCAMSSFGYVVGGAQTIVDALMDTVGYNGTLLMALQNAENCEPTYNQNAQISCDDMQMIRDNLPVFNKKATDANQMGEVVNNLRRREGVVISNHPRNSFVSWGKYAKLLCNRHSLHFSLSEESPTARLTELKGYILLMGCDYDKTTALHLAEYRSDVRPIQVQGSAIEVDGQRIWKKHLDMDLDSSEFIAIGKRLETKKIATTFKIGSCICKLFRSDLAVDEAVRYFAETNCLKYYRKEK